MIARCKETAIGQYFTHFGVYRLLYACNIPRNKHAILVISVERWLKNTITRQPNLCLKALYFGYFIIRGSGRNHIDAITYGSFVSVAVLIHRPKIFQEQTARTTAVEVHGSVRANKPHNLGQLFCRCSRRNGTTSVYHTMNGRLLILRVTKPRSRVQFVPYFGRIYVTILQHGTALVAANHVGKGRSGTTDRQVQCDFHLRPSC